MRLRTAAALRRTLAALRRTFPTMARRVGICYDDPAGRLLYQERRTLDSKTLDLDGLGRLPEGRLGQTYADCMRGHGITPEIFDGSPEQLSESQAAYFVQ